MRSNGSQALAIVLAAGAVHAQDTEKTIYGCVDVGCPASTRDSANDNCTVAGRSFPYVGVTRIPTSSEALTGLTWSKGFNITGDGERRFGSSYYLGSPADLDLSNTGACAIFFHGASRSISFETDPATDETTQGTCSDAMGSACVDALTARARNLDIGDGASSEEVCARLRDDLRENMDDACARITGGSWSNLTTVALTGNGAPEPITSQQNASSNCWPVTEKQHDLTLVSDYQVQGGNLVNEVYEAQWAITPILTLFYPNGEGSLVDAADASLSCIKVMGPALASVDTMDNGTTDTEGGAASLSISGSYYSGLMVLLSSFIAFIA
ncbi:hypothetical protein DL766_005617 [Monosporascus sp. MC13-8B]|uniref:Uncharacterized protein n=1 Tax=Monosporascus cannonballus TaxID=155416 RepID=A0ABY0GW74_9PEZI|nr:hypothetical protein DL762_010060 [Monosporascus cannonballus]RYO76755.1 hypothetical protein DL763_010142 [Monosporascus cannonballus]RYP28915.1 hypothetical protein DL766_005617 [Monosporascus sp. MC13-8B]